MKAKFINDVLNEKFEEKSDPIEDMGIGIKKKYEDFLQSNGLVHVHKPFQTALGYAAYQGEYDIVKFILERGIRPDTDHGHPVRQAIRAGNLKMIKLLMEYNVDILSYGDKFLEWTILEGNTYSNKYLEIFEYFLQHGATPGAVFFYSMTNSVDKRYYDLIKKYKGWDILGESVNEKFEEHSDPITDMGIGENLIVYDIVEINTDQYAYSINNEILEKIIRDEFDNIISDNELDRFMTFTLESILDEIPLSYFKKNDLKNINKYIIKEIKSESNHWLLLHGDVAMRHMMKRK